MSWSRHRRARRVREGQYQVKLPKGERELLRDLPGQLLDLLGTDDPSLERLFPPAYTAEEDAEANTDYRRLMHPDLLEHHRGSLVTLSATADAEMLDEEQMSAWLSAVNDLRLVLGTRIGVTEDMAPLTAADPRYQAMGVYAYLSVLQEQLVEAMAL
ncbi:MAG: DUF2017 family protein [Acidimicrobiales bacterium]